MCKPCNTQPAVRFATQPSYAEAAAMFAAALGDGGDTLPEHYASAKRNHHRGHYRELPIKVGEYHGTMRMFRSGEITFHVPRARKFDGRVLMESPAVREGLPAA